MLAAYSTTYDITPMLLVTDTNHTIILLLSQNVSTLRTHITSTWIVSNANLSGLGKYIVLLCTLVLDLVFAYSIQGCISEHTEMKFMKPC